MPLLQWLQQLPGVGENGWTAAAPHDGIFKPNTSVACFLQQQDWDELGLQLSKSLAAAGPGLPAHPCCQHILVA